MSEEVKKFQILGNFNPSKEEVLGVLVDMNIVQPLSNATGALYVDDNDKIYVL